MSYRTGKRGATWEAVVNLMLVAFILGLVVGMGWHVREGAKSNGNFAC